MSTKNTFSLLVGSLVALYLFENNSNVLVENSQGYGGIADIAITAMQLLILLLWFAVASDEFSKKIYEIVFPHNTKQQDAGTKNIANVISTFVVAGVMVIGLLLRYDFVAHREANSADLTGKYLGTLGDFFGGVLNPILTFFTLIALALTVVMQRMQLRDTKTEAEEISRLSQLQTFETTFFNLINLHTTTVQDLRIKPDQIIATMSAVYQSGNQKARPSNSGDLSHNHEITGRLVLSEVIRILQISIQNSKTTPMKTYSIIQDQHNHVLGRYFRNLYQVLEFIDEFSSRYSSGFKNDGGHQGKRYADILRAQLSSDELILLFFNCSEDMVDRGEFREKVKKYELLEHLPLEYESHTINISGFKADIESELTQYFYHLDKKIESPGAFGKNWAIEDYLIEKFSYAPINKMN